MVKIFIILDGFALNARSLARLKMKKSVSYNSNYVN